MAWHAKPKGGYTRDSAEYLENIQELNAIFSSYGFTLESICGVIASCGGSESGMNPWRWQGDVADIERSDWGYGLPQWTPASGYIRGYGVDVDGFAPNLSTSTITAGANASDGKAQCIVMATNKSGKYFYVPGPYPRGRTCPYLDNSIYPKIDDYKQITDIWTATVVWKWNFGFGYAPSMTEEFIRNVNLPAGIHAYEYLSGHPYPPTPTRKKSKIWKYLRNPYLYRMFL